VNGAAAIALLTVLVSAQPGAATASGARAEALRRELADVAARIERMKAAGVRGGPEIETLLARSQGLSSELEQLEHPPRRAAPAHPGADPQELRETADALRDEVDRLRAALVDVERRLASEGRRRRAGRLARLEEEGALFSEASPGRIGARSPASAAAEGAGGPAGPPGQTVPGPTVPSGPPGPTTSGPTGPTTTGPTAPGDSGGAGVPSTPPGSIDASPPPTSDPGTEPSAPAPAPAAGLGVHVWSSPAASRAWSERLVPARGDSESELRTKRDAIVRAIDEARARIQRIEAEARDLDARP
jgi:hypothetical protein